MVPKGYRLALTVRGKDYEVDGTDAALPHAPYPMKGVGPFTHTNPQDRPAEIFGGKNTLHFRRQGAVPAVADHSRGVSFCRKIKILTGRISMIKRVVTIALATLGSYWPSQRQR